jgi:aarF domain-containing kinase
MYEKVANKITDELCKMRGAPLKLAQMLSIQEDKLIPTPIRKAFEKAR